jgi:hypothetical protein
MNTGSAIFLLGGTGLSLFAALKVWLVFRRSDVGPELMTDAVLLVLGAVVCFWLSRRLARRSAK